MAKRKLIQLRNRGAKQLAVLREAGVRHYKKAEWLIGWDLPQKDDIDPIRESRRIVMAGTILIAITFGAGGLWAALAPLAGAIIVQATVKVESSHKTVQHLEGGIVKEILVRSGDRVEEGQPLVVLEHVQTTSMLEVLQLQLYGELAKAARLEATRERADKIDFPGPLLAKQDDPRIAAFMQKEKAFFDAQRQLLEGEANLLRSQALEVKEQIKGLSSQLRSANEGVGYLREEIAKNEALYGKQYVSHSKLLELKRELSARDERHGQYLTSISEAKQKAAELELRVINLYDDYIKTATEESKETTKHVADLNERIRPLMDTLERQTIVAPASGIVMDMKITTAGGVIAPREPLMDIVPENAKLIAEGDIKPENIDDIGVGREVDIQLTAFRRRVTPMAKGRVKYLSADAIVNPSLGTREPHYIVKIEIDEGSISKLGDEIMLTPGMPITAFIKTRERTVLDYLLEPITDTIRHAFKES